MSVLAILTIAGFGILIAVLAVYLLAVIALLAKVSYNLKKVVSDLKGLPQVVAPLDETISDINGRLRHLNDALG